MVDDEPLFPVVGIGASAGGIQAIEELFRALPADLGFGFVIVTHLSPDHESHLHEIIERCTTMPVLVAEDGLAVRRNCVYVMPANAILTMENLHLRMRSPNRVRRERNPIDLFLTSLAQDRGDYAAAIVLSGGGGDGTLGVKAIREQGGLTLAQTSDGSAPAYRDMPASAIATGSVDYPVPIHTMPEKLAQFQQSFSLNEPFGSSDIEDGRSLENRKRIYEVLRKQTGHDFAGYKIKTFSRRINRRMQILQLASFPAYVERLDEDPDEVKNLFRDLLINVTNFFRDADAFKALESVVIPKLFEGRGADDNVRIWVPGCATGEEVFSIGMLLREHMETLRSVPRVQIFATDIDDAALVVARTARYPEMSLSAVSPARRQRFFVEDGGISTVAKEVRDLCVFSPHSVIRDPPFSRIDLVSCRNLMIYLGAEIQAQVIPVFHYALTPNGYLFLGTSENIGDFSDLFAPVDKKQRLFQARDHGATKRLPIAMYGARPPFAATHASPASGTPLRHQIETRIIDRFAPSHVVVNADGDVVYYSHYTGRYLEAPHGPPTRQLMALARRGLRLELRSAMQDAVETKQTVVRRTTMLEEENGTQQMVKLVVDPLFEKEGPDSLFLVLFEVIEPVRDIQPASGSDVQPKDAIAALERDLRATRERLQSMIEEYETAIEELKSSNEELVSVNEELQSTNEEMEASKEELQSLNEELQTVNVELTGKLDDLDRVNGDLKNLFESTQIATVFLDRELVIRSFTPAISKIFRIIPSDRGRPLTDLAINPVYPSLPDDVRHVFGSGETIEHRIEDPADKARYLARLIPYRGMDERIDGVVITFVNITTLLESQK